MTIERDRGWIGDDEREIGRGELGGPKVEERNRYMVGSEGI